MARAANAIATKGGGEKPKFSVAIRSEGIQSLIRASLPTAEDAARYTGSLIAAVSASEALQNCNPASVVAAGLRGAGMGLILGNGYHIVPFGSQAAFVISYKGLIALALAGGDVADMDCIEVREGEYVGRNKRTKRPEFDFSVYATEEEMEKHPVIGYFAYCEKKDGYFRGEYMSLNAILDHAERYSRSFNRKAFLSLWNGEVTGREAESLRARSPWYSTPEIMLKKTVLRRLLNSGYITLAASATINRAMVQDAEEEESTDAIAAFDVVSVDHETGELTSESVGGYDATQTPADDKPSGNKRKKAKDADFDPAETDAEVEGLFD